MSWWFCGHIMNLYSYLYVCAEHPADGAVVIALKVAQQVVVGLIGHVNHILVIPERTQLGVGGHILDEEQKCWESKKKAGHFPFYKTFSYSKPIFFTLVTAHFWLNLPL